MNFTLGIEGDFPSGNQHWDASITTGRSDNVVDQLGSARLTSYRDVLTSPNFGAGATFDQNPWEAAGFAESTPTCTSGLPVVDNRQVSADCVQIIAPSLKNVREMTQSIFEMNLTATWPDERRSSTHSARTIEERLRLHMDNERHPERGRPDRGLFPTEHSAGVST